MTGKALEGTSITLQGSSIGALTNNAGYFNFCHIKPDRYTLIVDHIGYEKDTINIDLNELVMPLDIRLKPQDIVLKEVIFTTKDPVHTQVVELRPAPVTSFGQLLNILPETATMNIGANVSKPVVRGLSFDRVSVINRGIIQQNQQWGADHGLEINQFDMYSTTVYRGPNALLLGSSTTTTIEIEPYKFKNTKDFFNGEATLWGASSNDEIGGALTAEWQKNKWYARGSFSYRDYADYRVPAKSIIYEEEEISLPGKRVPNTAGKEHSISGTVGFRERNVTTYFNVSNNYQKNGLFELGHSHEEHEHEEGEHDHDHDHDHDAAEDTSHRNIGLPYATSNHLMVTNNTEWQKGNNTKLVVNTAYQSNHRKEFEHFHEHYEGQQSPVTNDDLAVDFKLHTYSVNARLHLGMKEKWRNSFSANAEYRQNQIGGFEYFLPRYNQISGGLAYVSGYEISDRWLVEAAVRYDIGNMDVTGFYDSSLAGHLAEEGYDPQIVQQYAQRAYDVDRNFGGISGNIGVRYKPADDLTLKLNIGKSYRMPSANELAANGLHHAAYRYEIGNPKLDPEHGYIFNLDTEYKARNITGLDGRYHTLEIYFNPFAYYYSNYIYLQAVDNQAVVLYEQQPYQYTQAKAVYGGGEYKVVWPVITKLVLSTQGSLVLNKNLDNKEPLPFTPPFTMTNEVKFRNDDIRSKKIDHYQIGVSHRWYADQNRVGIGEEKTAGTNLFDFSAGIVYKFNSRLSVDVNMQVRNIFDTRYLNHLSLYRRLNIPEQGRNFQLFIRIPFKS